MIQTQLLKADKPYQIISAGELVGIQVATLIVTEDKVADDGSYIIDTHSHPVVNYGNKEGLREDLKYWNGNPDEEYKYSQRLQPEGAVWNKVEVRDIRVLGIVGANNPPVDLERFVYLIPCSRVVIPQDGIPLWDRNTSSKIFNLRYGLERAGISFNRIIWNEKETLNIYLKHEYNELVDNNYVRVIIRDASEYNPMQGEISFRVVFDKEKPVDSQVAIICCMRELDDLFIKVGNNLRFISRSSSEPKDEWDDLLDRCADHMNSIGWKHRYGLG